MLEETRIVIVGAGHGGATAAVELKARGYEGEVLLLSDEPVAPYERPPLSKAWLTSEEGKPSLYDEETLAGRGVTFRAGARAERLDREEKAVILSGGERIGYGKLILATGSLARRLSLPGAELGGVHTLRTAGDAEALRLELRPGRRLAVIGGGYIGLEVAASARKLGAEVTVIELAPRLMARTASEEVSAFFRAVHEAHGVRFLFGQGVDAILGEGRATGVRLGSGEEVRADAVLMAAGGMPDCALAREAGLPCEGGVLVDEEARTPDPDVYAIGDLSLRPTPFAEGRIRLESVHNALEQARIAAASITGTKPPRLEAPWFWSDQYGLKLQIAGLVPPEGQRVVRRGEGRLAVFHLAAQRLMAVEAVNDPRAYMVGRKALTTGQGVDAEVLADPAADVKDALV